MADIQHTSQIYYMANQNYTDIFFLDLHLSKT